LFDMHGNVWEWCSDWHGDLVSGADKGGAYFDSLRVLRGGCFMFGASECRSASRVGGRPGFDWKVFGFRLVLSSPPQQVH
ncbi:MAG: SUMF1/EgtB/PvdO family nonheme iron enzyme, partial [Planctomycetota bacterium]